MKIRSFALTAFTILLLLGSAPADKTARQTAGQEACIAFFIQISEATLTLLPRLLHRVWHVQNVYIVHFDKKIPEWQRRHANASLFHGNRHFTTNVHILPSEVVTYRGISMVLNVLSAMQKALDVHPNWDFFINISGSDYPLVAPLALRRLLARNDFIARNRSFFTFAELAWWKESRHFRYDRLFTDTSLSLNASQSQVVDSFTENPLTHVNNFTFTAAEAWMILHRSFVHHLLTSSFARRLLLAFSYSLEPEEHYFSTVAFNTPTFNSTSVPHSLRFVAWVHNGTHAGQHPYYIDTKQDNDWTFAERLQYSGCIFARKVRIQDSPFLNYLDTNFNGLSPTPHTTSVTAYLQRATSSIDCISKLPPLTPTLHCFDQL